MLASDRLLRRPAYRYPYSAQRRLSPTSPSAPHVATHTIMSDHEHMEATELASQLPPHTITFTVALSLH